MAFFQRVMSYLLNEVLVNGLANRQDARLCSCSGVQVWASMPGVGSLNTCARVACCSRTFQKFAIRSSAVVEEAAKKTAQGRQQLGEQGSEFFKVFREEVRACLPPQPPSSRLVANA